MKLQATLFVGLGAILGIIAGFVMPHTTKGTGTDVPAIDDAKVQVLSDYFYDEARLGETPVVDLTTATPDEVSQAYVDKVNDLQITDPKPNLLETLRDEAVQRAEACTPL